jgi:hypothetical protein
MASAKPSRASVQAVTAQVGTVVDPGWTPGFARTLENFSIAYTTK